MTFKRILVISAVVVLLAGVIKTGYHKFMDRFFPLMYEDIIEKYSENEGIDKYLVMAVINAESGFDPTAHSGVAKGLMQITDETAMWVSGKIGLSYYEDMAYDPEVNIKMGCWYLRYLVGRYDDLNTALAAYNAGHGNVDRWLSEERYSPDGKTLDKIPYKETEKYVMRVRRSYGIYQKAY